MPWAPNKVGAEADGCRDVLRDVDVIKAVDGHKHHTFMAQENSSYESSNEPLKAYGNTTLWILLYVKSGHQLKS